MKDRPVIVRSIMVNKREGTKQVAFVQERLRALDKVSNMLSIMMMGDQKFGNPFQNIVTFQIMSDQAIEAFGLVIGATFPESWLPKVVIHEFCEGDVIPVTIRSHYEDAIIYKPRVWEGGGIAPKMSAPVKGKRQTILTHGGKPIYRQTHLVIADMDHKDYFVKHDNKVSVEQAVESIGEPSMEFIV